MRASPTTGPGNLTPPIAAVRIMVQLAKEALQ